MKDTPRGEVALRRVMRWGVLAGLMVTVLWLCIPVQQASARRALSGTFAIAGGSAYVRSMEVTLDSQVRGATTMRFRRPDGSYTAWEPYATKKTWTLSDGDGVKSVEAQYRGASAAKVVLVDVITLDTTGPVTTSDYDGVARSCVPVTLLPVDTLCGVAGTWYRVDGRAWRTGTFATLHVQLKRTGLGAGRHTFEYFSTDLLGNSGPVASEIVTLMY